MPHLLSTKVSYLTEIYFCNFYFIPLTSSLVYQLLYYLLKNILLIFVQRGRERDREQETSMRESHRSAASCTPPTGDMPATKVHALDRNRTRVPSDPKPTLYPLSQTGLGPVLVNFYPTFYLYKFVYSIYLI